MAVSGNALVACILQLISTSLGLNDIGYFFESSGDDFSTTASPDCRYDTDCITGYCCRETMTCCDPPYLGVITKCRRSGIYTGLDCPPTYDPSRVFCCYAGRRCCGSNIGTPYSGPEHGKNTVLRSGVNSMGAIAGFVFLAVIIIGTLLTLATRYIKIKVRREQRRAGIESQAYQDALNRRSNAPDHGQNHNPDPCCNTTASVPPQSQLQQPPDPHYTESGPVEENGDAGEAGPPPSYDEAMATCPTVEERSNGLSTENGVTNFQFRPPTRPNRRQQVNTENIPLSVWKDNYDPIQPTGVDATNTSLSTIPKEDVSRT